ncbi:MAG: hypothetical protein R8G66_08050 [Cytophagales bacterium]|nr:hypothetical protein [Cytophagales bacterium]
MKHFPAILVLIAMVACSAPQQDQQADIPPPPPPTRSFTATMTKAFEAHGGIDNWDKFQTLTYEKVGEEENEKQVIDLKNRKVRVSTSDFTIGFDGTDVWVTPDSTAFPRNARFYHNLYFYFFALPYLAADPGVNLTDLGQVEIEGVTYDKTLMTFGENVGDSPKDQYVLYFDETGILRLINYSVTYYDESRATQYSAIRYENWTDVNGVQLPQALNWYKWENDTLGEKRGGAEFTNITLSTEAMDESTYAKPEGAYVSPK